MKDYEKYNKIVRAKIPCETEWRKLISADNDAGYFAVLKNNIAWLVSENIASKLIDFFTAERLAEQNIYFNGSYSINGKFGVALDNSTVKALDNSTVEALDNSTVEAWGNSTVKAWDNSTVKAWGNSTVEAWDNSKVEALDNSTVEAWGNSTVKALDNSTVKALDNSTVEALDNSTVKALDNSTVEAWGNSTVEAWGNSTIIFRHYGLPKFSYDKEKTIFVILKDELNGKTHIIVNGVETVIENPK